MPAGTARATRGVQERVRSSVFFSEVSSPQASPIRSRSFSNNGSGQYTKLMPLEGKSCIFPIHQNLGRVTSECSLIIHSILLDIRKAQKYSCPTFYPVKCLGSRERYLHAGRGAQGAPVEVRPFCCEDATPFFLPDPCPWAYIKWCREVFTTLANHRVPFSGRPVYTPFTLTHLITLIVRLSFRTF